MPIGKKKTALTDAKRKKENSFNRCQSEKTNFKRLVSNKLNDQKIWISKRRYWLYSKNSKLDIFFRLRPFRIKCEQHYSSVNTFLFRHIFFRNREHFSFSHVIKADWTFVIWTQRESTQRRKSTTTTRSYSDVEVTKSTSSYEKSKQWR